MLRAISEIAAAISVISEPAKPSSVASSRPCCRAVTMSIVEWISRRISSAGFCMVLGFQIQEGQPFLEVEGRTHSFEGEAELDHGEGHFGLDADDHGVGAAEVQHVRDIPER